MGSLMLSAATSSLYNQPAPRPVQAGNPGKAMSGMLRCHSQPPAAVKSAVWCPCNNPLQQWHRRPSAECSQAVPVRLS